MKLETFEDLERLLKLVDEHRIEHIKVDNVEVTKSPVVPEVRATLEHEQQAVPETGSIWDDPLLFPGGPQ